MCCQFYFAEETFTEVRKMVQSIDGSFRKVRMNRDIHPTEFSPVVIVRDGKKVLCGQRFGLQAAKGKGLVLNARVETVQEKPMFQNGIRFRRAVIPAASFYEWNRKKEKNTFSREDGGMLYLAGFYDFDGEEERFVILTTAANESMIRVHDRMPLILEKGQVGEWLLDDRKTGAILHQKPVLLQRKFDYEQMTLF